MSLFNYILFFRKRMSPVCQLAGCVKFAFLLLLFPQMAFAAAQYTVEIKPAPVWVQQVQTSKPDTIPVDDIESGNYYLLVDNQLKIDETSSKVRFNRIQQLVVNQRGLEHNSQIEVDFDPLYESLVFHSLAIIRDDQTIDKLASSDISVLKQEGRIEQGLYDGRLTANIILADLRVGDVIDYSYSVIGANPIYQGIFSYRRTLQWSVPLYAQSVRVLWGKAKPLYVDVTNAPNTVSQKDITLDNKPYVEYAISRSNSPILITESNTPTWYNPFVTVYFSEINRWGRVVDWAQPLYHQPEINANNVQEVINEIKLKTSVPNQQVMLALNYVQDQIRYLGLEMGINSHQPSKAEDTLERRYGDCKDKVVLFIALLKGMDIDAYPVLVDTEEGLDLPLQPVSINAFNHVIAKVQVLGMTYWLDPTMNYQRGPLSAIYQADYDYGLVIKPGVSELAEIKIHDPQSMLVKTEIYDLSAGKDGESKLTAKNQYLGDRAQNLRYQLEDIGFKALQSLYEDYYRELFSDIKLIDKVIISDDKQTGVLYTQQDYVIQQAWQPEGDNFDIGFTSHSIRNALNKPSKAERSSPYWISFPNKIHHTIEIKVSNGNWTFPSESLVEDNPYFSYEYSANFNDDAKVLTLKFNYRSKAGAIPEMNIGDYIAAIEKIEESLYYSIITYGDGASTANEASDSGAAVNEGLSTQDELILFAVLLYILGVIYAIATWRIDSSSRLEYCDEVYYPVSRRKMLILSLATGGIYTSYWIYRNWKYVKQTEQLGIMPIARGIFSAFWYYPLFSHLVADSKARFAKNTIMPMGIGVVAAILFFIANYSYNTDNWYLVGMLASPILLFPMLSYIIGLNGRDSHAYIANSKWKARHSVISLLFLPWIFFAVGKDLAILPSGKVLMGEQLFQRNIDFMNDNNIVKDNEDILMFYSDGLISYEDDGNGFTRSSVFSYWNEEGELNIKTADFVDVKNLKVEYGNDTDEQTVITVELNDESQFLLIISTLDKLDQDFYQRLRKNWYQTNKLADNKES